jgi:hypothetical protein
MNWVPPYWIVPVLLVVLTYLGITGRLTSTWDQHRRSTRLLSAAAVAAFLFVVATSVRDGLAMAALYIVATELFYYAGNAWRRRRLGRQAEAA